MDVVVLNWNGAALLRSALESLRAQTRSHTPIVVDNGSTDGSVGLVRREFPDTTVVELPENLGFGAGNNRGIASGSAEYLVIVNNDVECDPAFLERLVQPFADGEVGMVAALLLRPGRESVDSYGLELDRTLAAFPRFAGEAYPGTILHEHGLAMPTGGAAAYRRSAFEQAGGFDERLFAYMEDVDLGLRLRSAGWTCAGAVDAVGVHLGSASFGRRSRRQVELGGIARGFMLRKYGVLRRWPRTAAAALAAEAAAVSAETVLGRDFAALRGRIIGWRRAEAATEAVPSGAVNPAIGLMGSLRRRRKAL